MTTLQQQSLVNHNHNQKPLIWATWLPAPSTHTRNISGQNEPCLHRYHSEIQYFVKVHCLRLQTPEKYLLLAQNVLCLLLSSWQQCLAMQIATATRVAMMSGSRGSPVRLYGFACLAVMQSEPESTWERICKVIQSKLFVSGSKKFLFLLLVFFFFWRGSTSASYQDIFLNFFCYHMLLFSWRARGTAELSSVSGLQPAHQRWFHPPLRFLLSLVSSTSAQHSAAWTLFP